MAAVTDRVTGVHEASACLDPVSRAVPYQEIQAKVLNPSLVSERRKSPVFLFSRLFGTGGLTAARFFPP